MRFVNCHVVETETLNHFSGCADTFYVTADDELFAACLGQPIVTDDHNGVAWCVFNQSGQLFLTPFFVHRSVDWNEVPVVLSMLAHVLDPVFGQTGWTQDQETLGFVVVDHHPDISQDGGRFPAPRAYIQDCKSRESAELREPLDLMREQLKLRT